MRNTGLFALLFALGTTACASLGEKGWADFNPELQVSLTSGARSAEIDALVADFYGDGDALALEPRITAALAQHPGSAELHEIAGYSAVLRGESHEAFVHFLRAAADRNAISPELYLFEMKVLAHTVVEHLDAQALLREIALRHPRPAVRDVAIAYLAHELDALGQREEAQALTHSLGFVDAWSIVGAFDNDQGKGLRIAYPPERMADRDRDYAGLRLPVSWRSAESGAADGLLALGERVHPAETAVAYARSFVISPRTRQLDLRITTSDPVAAWLDGKLVAMEDKITRDEIDNVTVRVTLHEGHNRLLVKSAHAGGVWRVGARFTEPGGGRAADLRFEAAPLPVPAMEKPAEGKALTVSKTAAIDALADKNRKRFLLGRMSVRQGHVHRAAWSIEPWLADAPKNPLAMLFAAISVWDNGEAGKALDLLNRGVAAHPKATAFLVRRGRFYANRKLWDKAQQDLSAAVAASPRAREAAIELATVYAQRGFTTDRCQSLEADIVKWPDSTYFLSELGQCQAEQGYVREAEKTLRRAAALAPGQPLTLDRLSRIADRRGDFDAALEWMRQVRAARPAWIEPQLAEADLLRRSGHAADAQRLLEAARAQSPDSPRAYDRLASLAYEQKRRPEAERLWRLALERDPDSGALADRVAFLSPATSTLTDKLAPGSEEIEKIIRSAKGIVAHPGSHVVVLLDDEVTYVNPDGSAKHVVTRVEQVANTEGRDALIQAHLPSHGRVKVLEAYSIKRNGERQEASSITPGLVRFRSLDVGSIVVKQYVHYAPPGRFLPNEFTASFRFQELNAQVELSRWRILLGKDRALNTVVRGPIERSEEIVDGSRLYTFTARGIAPLISEPNMAPLADVQWAVSASTLKSWDAYVKWENALLADAFSPSRELDALAKKLTAGARTPREKLERLWAHVAQEIRYQQEYEDTIAGVKPHAAAVVVERGYGDCKDKSVLLIRLGRAVGLDMRFAILRTTPFGKVLRDLPNQQFNHAITFVPKQSGIDDGLFVDTTTNGLDIGNLRTDDQGADSLVLDPRTGAWEFVPIPYQTPELESVKHTIAVDLSTDKPRATDKLEVRGGVAAGLRVSLRSGENARKAYQSISEQVLPGTTLIEGKADRDQDLTRPLSIRLDIDAANAVQSDGDRSRFNVPFPFPLTSRATLASRQHPLLLWRGTQAMELVIDLPEGNEATHLPADLKVEHACFSIERKAKATGRKITITTAFRNQCAEIAPKDYPAFRAAVQKAVVLGPDNVVFGPAGKGKKPPR